MQMTAEQQAIVACKAKSIVVKAPAGSGKTSTLVEFAKARPRERMTYLAFNRAIKEEASRKFPSNVRCVTTHGLAYAFFGPVYKHKLGNPKPYHLAQSFNIHAQTGYAALNTLNAWLVSADPAMTEEHVIRGNAIPPKSMSAALEVARKAWANMLDVAKDDIPMPHDGYLKLYQLSGQVIATDRILFDECQDSNPVTQAIVNSQRCQKVYIGDERQAIYAFRGANNIMAQIGAEAEFHLTNSFRFGDGVAAMANAILSSHDEHPFPVVGRGQHKTVMAVNRQRPHTLLARTNAVLFAEAVGVLEAGNPFGFVGGVDNYRFDTVLDAYHLKRGMTEKVRDRFVRAFADYAQMSDYAESTDDHEIKFLVKIVDKYGNDIPEYTRRIKSEAVSELTGKEVVLTTGHKAKGLEWMDVVLTDDFTDLSIKEDKETKMQVPPNPQEINLLYVATTRAMRGIQMPEPLVDWFAKNHPAISSQIKRDNLAAHSEEIIAEFSREKSNPFCTENQKPKAERRPVASPGPTARSGSPWSEGEISNMIANWKFSKMDADTIARQSQRTTNAVMMKLASELRTDIDELRIENERRKSATKPKTRMSA